MVSGSDEMAVGKVSPHDVVNAEEGGPDQEIGEDDGKIDDPGQEQGPLPLPEVFAGEHPLGQILVGAQRREGLETAVDEGDQEKSAAGEGEVEVEYPQLIRGDQVFHPRPSPGDSIEEKADNDPGPPHEDDELKDVGPDDRLDPADQGVEKGDHRHRDDDDEERETGDHAQHQGNDQEPHPAGQKPGDEEEDHRGQPAPFPEALGQKLVDRGDPAPVESGEKEPRDQAPAQEGTEGELEIGVIAPV